MPRKYPINRKGKKNNHDPKTGCFTIGNSGREKKFKTVNDLQNAITDYFELCDSHTREVYDKPSQSIKTINIQIPYTIEGLCEVLDCDRLTLLNYEKQKGYEPFFNTIKEAKLKIQKNKLERGLSGESNPAVSIFDLKNNHGYVDKTSSELSGPGGKDLIPEKITEIEIIHVTK